MQQRIKIQEAASAITNLLQQQFASPIGIILGTGLGDWADSLKNGRYIGYDKIPHFPSSTVESHKGRLCFGMIGSHQVLALQGRFHLYEGYSPEEVCRGVRTLFELGARDLIITNAAGAINPLFTAGELMVVSDHINLTGHTPLTGKNEEAWGPRFPDMSRVYPENLQQLAMDTALQLGIRLERGVYAGVTGPNLETPAETRYLKRIGADAVGMSTVLEVIAAKHMSMRVLGISCLTNKNLPDCMEETSLEKVLAQAGSSSHKLESLLTSVIKGWPAG